MVDITEIMDMLDWHMPYEIQSKGIFLARDTETIIPFGALCILNRLQKYSDNNSIRNAVNVCIEKAKKRSDEAWESNLRLLQQCAEGDYAEI